MDITLANIKTDIIKLENAYNNIQQNLNKNLKSERTYVLHINQFYKELEDTKFFEINKTLESISENIILIMERYIRLTKIGTNNYVYFSGDPPLINVDPRCYSLIYFIRKIALKSGVHIISRSEKIESSDFIYEDTLMSEISKRFIRDHLICPKNNLELVDELDDCSIAANSSDDE